MNPALPDLLSGMAVAIATPPPPESAGDYMAGRLGILAMIASLAAQEAQAGPAARRAENALIRRLLTEATPRFDAAAGGRIAAALAPDDLDADDSWAGLDAVNARLRRALIALHEAVEAAGDSDWDRRIGDLYIQMAEGRRLRLPGE